MDIRYGANPNDAKHYTTRQLREEFLIEELFWPGKKHLVYSHIDRIIPGGVMPTTVPISLDQDIDTMKSLGTTYFLERRELGVINIGGPGTITLDGECIEMGCRDGLYAGNGTQTVVFASNDPANPAKFYLNSAPAHQQYPNYKIDISKAKASHVGDEASCNKRTVFQFIHPDVVATCQLMMGLTVLEEGSVWNTMPAHTHERRMEVYLYFDLSPEDVVFHYMGEPTETRHVVMKNEQAIISPSWSIHSGCGTKNYTLIWGMVGENQTYTDMDAIKIADLR